jgi:hypothetical protein
VRFRAPLHTKDFTFQIGVSTPVKASANNCKGGLSYTIMTAVTSFFLVDQERHQRIDVGKANRERACCNFGIVSRNSTSLIVTAMPSL